MILLDSCAVLDIVFGEAHAAEFVGILDNLQEKGQDIVLLNLILLESSAVVAVRYKEKKVTAKPLSAYLEKLAAFQAVSMNDDLSKGLIAQAASIKAEHAASMVDCYLIANAIQRHAEIITADQEILSYDKRHAKIRKLTDRFSGIKWSVT